jgi:Protein of unknown function (DUF1553)/Protein of unknown function (DUF1549)/Planctomycete cytochrome C
MFRGSLIIALAAHLLTLTATLAQSVDFDREIRPILADQCFQCHGPDENARQTDLRLDRRESVFADLGGYRAVVPGDLQESELITRVSTADADLRMPPPESKKRLTAHQIELLKRWVREGAKWNEHWAFVPPQLPKVPEVKDRNWPTGAIDRFILARLEKNGLSPSPVAERRTLVRRLYLDLIGLPPSAAEVRAFIHDERDGAYERLVDDLLNSPHFGERLAIPWLDQTRYADTNGYSIDGGREMWLWRDWVIDAYNDNMPFDQFLTEQIAGDLIPGTSEPQIVATGFLRNHMITNEGGTIPEENLVNYAADRVRTTAEVFLGLTMGCAQCHDHKYDPITQRDYYRFFAFFNELADVGLDGGSGVNAVPKISARTVLRDKSEIAAIQQRLTELKAELRKPHPAQPAWEAATRSALARRGDSLKLHPLEVLKVTEPNQQGGAFQVLDDGTVFVPSPLGRSPSVSLKAEAKLEKIDGMRIEFLPDDRFPQGGLGHGEKRFPGGFILTGFSVSSTALPSDQVDLYRIVDIAGATASRSDPQYPPSGCLDVRDHNGWSPGGNLHDPQHITFTFVEPINIRNSPYLTAMLIWGGVGIDDRDLIAGRYRFYAMTGNDDGTNVPTDIQALLSIASRKRTTVQAERLREYFASVRPEFDNVRFAIANLKDRLTQLTGKHETMVMNVANQPRHTHILNRGQYDQPMELVEAGVPAALPHLPEGEPANRLGLARWMLQPDHPLTSRVAVNRIWQLLFGRGIVTTSEDFGSQGEPPSHPELLDCLSIEFVNSGWHVKGLVKQIVMSATYRQQSDTTPEMLAVDPQNRLLARGPRRRLEAELLRDAALEISGLLVHRIGGASVNPYQPPGLWKEVSHFGSAHSSAQVFVQDHGEKLYRRSLYTYWKRTAPPPAMIAFDAPNRELCTMRRQETNTPLQALVLLNAPQFVEAARAFGQRILLDAPDPSIDGRFRFALEEATGRLPAAAEMKILHETYELQLRYWQANPSAAKRFLNVGEWRGDEALDPVELATWASLASLILNLSEVISVK